MLAIIALVFSVDSGSAFALSFDPPNEKTGAPNDGSCIECHVDNDLNTPGGLLTLEFPQTYIPNEVYTIVVSLARPGQSRWGFEMTALDGNGASAGSFEITDVENTQKSVANGKQYIKQTFTGTAQGTNDGNQWTVEWTAPDAEIGPITFYAAGNAANADSKPSGDYIYTTQGESTRAIPTVAGVTLEGEREKTTMDAVTGVSYTLKVTNTGNMTDTVTLETSAEVGIEASVLGTLSQNSIELDSGASSDVTLMVKGDTLTAPGDYEITVTATSKTDSTMTAEFTTTTTIEMPPPEVPPWDVNGDGTVNIQDLVLVAGQFGQRGESVVGDINGDGTVNIQDLVLVASRFGEKTGAGQ